MSGETKGEEFSFWRFDPGEKAEDWVRQHTCLRTVKSLLPAVADRLSINIGDEITEKEAGDDFLRFGPGLIRRERVKLVILADPECQRLAALADAEVDATRKGELQSEAFTRVMMLIDADDVQKAGT